MKFTERIFDEVMTSRVNYGMMISRYRATIQNGETNMNLYETLVKYSRSGIYPMHMPGHKRNPAFFMENPYELDVTEVEGLDNLHQPEGALLHLMEQMSRDYQTEQTYLLVNGSTGGILTAISACCQRGAKILMARNCHRSVYHAVYLLELEPVYLIPDADPATGICLGISPEQVREALRRHPDAACAVITSPTYEGVVSDIRGLSEAVHEKNIPLIVDEAHGAHFAWDEKMPEPAMAQGADLVVESIHKTLPAFTQTALLHRCGQRVPEERIRRYLDIYQSSSPSYILMAGAAQCMDWLRRQGKEAFALYEKRLERFRQQAGKWRMLSLWEPSCKEGSKLVILTGKSGLTGGQLAGRLRAEYRIETEMSAPGYVLAMTSVADTDEGFERLADALAAIDRELSLSGQTVVTGRNPDTDKNMNLLVDDANKYISEDHADDSAGDNSEEKELFCQSQVLTIYEAMERPWEAVPIEESAGRISAEYAMVYPPGVPFLAPGERIDSECRARIMDCLRRGENLMGLHEAAAGKIRVVVE